VEISDRTGFDPPAIVTGDFNSRPGNRTHKTFTGSGFADTYLAAGNEEGANTFHAFRGAGYRDAHRGPRRIDWIFLKDAQGRLRVESHRIIHDADESSGLYPSDHYPILADFSWSAGQWAANKETEPQPHESGEPTPKS
jgi:endonuclease/exonuclease/phosphatase family metal-dependent hydrolase